MVHQLDKLLELGNGLWTITCAWLMVFLAYHLIKVSRLRRVGLGRWLFRLPLSMQLALGVLVACVGIVIRTGQVWLDRMLNGGALSGAVMFSTFWFVAGTLIAVTGFMCILRVATRPMLGNWPWVGAAFCMLVYIAIWAATL